MSRLAYTVIASFLDLSTAEAFIAWLRGGHTDGVIAGGAESAMIVRLDPDPPAPAPVSPGVGAGGSGGSGGAGAAAGGRARVEVRYVFPSRAVFERYLEIHAPALRAEGLAKFGPAQGVTMTRSIGEVV